MFGTPNWKLTAGSPKNHPLLKREIIWTKSPWNGFHVNFPGYIHLGFPGCNQPTLNPTRFFSYAIAGRLPSISNATLWQLSRGWVWLVGWLVRFCYSHWCVTARCLEEPIPFLGEVTWVLYPQSTFDGCSCVATSWLMVFFHFLPVELGSQPTAGRDYPTIGWSSRLEILGKVLLGGF